MIRLGIFLTVFGVVAGFGSMIVILATDLAVPVLEPLFCPENDTLIRETRPTFEGENVDYYCVDDDGGERTDVAGKLFLVIFGLIGLFPIGILLTVWWAMRAAKRTVQGNIQMTQSYRTSNDAYEDVMGTLQDKARRVQSDSSLQDKLGQLQEAYDAGLIDRAEYDARKKELLDNFVE